MGFFEKVKNMFTEEVEEDEVKVEQIKRDVKRVPIESPVANDDDEYNDELDERIIFTAETKEAKPIFFDDNDFKDLNLTEDEPKKEEKKIETREVKLYSAEPTVNHTVEEKKIFKPTPIISPVYGVLDKNYHKEDIVSRSEKLEEEKKEESPIDTIRNKAYGTLEDELENTLFGSNSILFKKDEEKETQIKEVDSDVLTNLTDDISKELDELLVKKEKYLDDEEETVKEEKRESNNDEDLLDFIDSTLYKDGDE